MKTKRKIAFFLALLSLIYCLNLMQTTYAKYVSSANADTNLTIARWDILINNQDINANSNFSTSIAPVFEGTQYIKAGKLAPTSEGYFDITINGVNTDVSFNYTLDISPSSSNTVDDLTITGYSLNGGTVNQLNGDLTGLINYNDSIKSHTYRIYVTWIDGTGEEMNNAADTAAANNGVAQFDINVNLIQAH